MKIARGKFDDTSRECAFEENAAEITRNLFNGERSGGMCIDTREFILRGRLSTLRFVSILKKKKKKNYERRKG